MFLLNHSVNLSSITDYIYLEGSRDILYNLPVDLDSLFFTVNDFDASFNYNVNFK